MAYSKTYLRQLTMIRKQRTNQSRYRAKIRSRLGKTKSYKWVILKMQGIKSGILIKKVTLVSPGVHTKEAGPGPFCAEKATLERQDKQLFQM